MKYKFNKQYSHHQTIAKNTKTNIFDRKQKNETAKQAELFRKELLYLLWDRVKIAHKRIPVPSLSQWDSFLAHETRGVLDINDSWRNAFYTFTALGTSTRFPALLADQLSGLYKIINLRVNIEQLLKNHLGTLPLKDKLEPTSHRIAGISHLEALVPDLIQKQRQLSSFVLYTQLSSISNILDKITNPSDNIKNLQKKILSLSSNIKQQAEQNNYQVTIPDQKVFTDLIEQIKNLSCKELQIRTANKEELISNLSRLNKFYYGSKQERLEATQITSRPSIFMRQIHKFKRFLLAIIKIYNNIREYGFVSAAAMLFNVQSINKQPANITTTVTAHSPDIAEGYTKATNEHHTKQPCLAYFSALSEKCHTQDKCNERPTLSLRA